MILRYQGIDVPLAMHPPTHEELLESEDAVLQMSGYLLRRLADRVDIRPLGRDSCELRLVFND